MQSMGLAPLCLAPVDSPARMAQRLSRRRMCLWLTTWWRPWPTLPQTTLAAAAGASCESFHTWCSLLCAGDLCGFAGLAPPVQVLSGHCGSCLSPHSMPCPQHMLQLIRIQKSGLSSAGLESLQVLRSEVPDRSGHCELHWASQQPYLSCRAADHLSGLHARQKRFCCNRHLRPHCPRQPLAEPEPYLHQLLEQHIGEGGLPQQMHHHVAAALQLPSASPAASA